MKKLCLCIALIVTLSMLMTACQSRKENEESSDNTYSQVELETASSTATTIGSNSFTDTEKNTDSSTVVSFDTNVTTATTTIVESGTKQKITNTTGQTASGLTISVKEWHPGIPGYDVEYTMIAEKNDQLIGSNQMTYTCRTPGVSISGNTVTVPESVRNSAQQIEIVGSNGNASASTSIACKAWTNTFDDEFDGTNLDSSKWKTFEEGTGSIAAHISDCYEVSNGTLKLFVQKQQRKYNTKTYDYTEGSICTDGTFSQAYGLFTCSMKIPKHDAIMNAFWLLPGGAYATNFMYYKKSNSMAGCGELDIVEISSSWGQRYSLTEHFFDLSSNKEHTMTNSYVDFASNPCNQFVEYTCAWLPEGLYYYVDGKLVYVDTDIGEKGGYNGEKTVKKAYMILTLGMYPPDNTWCGPWAFEDSDFPIVMETNYVRAYS